MKEQWTIMVPVFITVTGDASTLKDHSIDINTSIKNALNKAFNTDTDDDLTDRIHYEFDQIDVDADVIEVEVSDPTTTHIAHI